MRKKVRLVTDILKYMHLCASKFSNEAKKELYK